MLKWIEATGRSEDAAVQNALAQLGLDRDSVSVEVLERAKSGFLGFGSAPAKVKVTYEVPDEEARPPAGACTAEAAGPRARPEGGPGSRPGAGTGEGRPRSGPGCPRCRGSTGPRRPER